MSGKFFLFLSLCALLLVASSAVAAPVSDTGLSCTDLSQVAAPEAAVPLPWEEPLDLATCACTSADCDFCGPCGGTVVSCRLLPNGHCAAICRCRPQC